MLVYVKYCRINVGVGVVVGWRVTMTDVVQKTRLGNSRVLGHVATWQAFRALGLSYVWKGPGSEKHSTLRWGVSSCRIRSQKKTRVADLGPAPRTG